MLIARTRYPDEIERGKDTVISLAVYDDATGAEQTATAGTVTIYAGSSEFVSAASVTAGAPSTYTVLGSATASESLSGEWLEVWTLTIGGASYTFSRPAYLVRRPYRHTISQADLTELHPDLATRESAGTLDLDGYIQAADTVIRRELIKRGNRPELVIDAWSLADAHRYKALELLFRDDSHSVGDGRYSDLAAQYAELYAAEWSSISFHYDYDTDGTIDAAEERRAGAPVVFLTSRKRWWT